MEVKNPRPGMCCFVRVRNGGHIRSAMGCKAGRSFLSSDKANRWQRIRITAYELTCYDCAVFDFAGLDPSTS